MSDDNLQTLVLKHLDKYEAIDSSVLAAALETDHQHIVGIIKSLECFDEVINVEPRNVKRWELTKEGEQVSLEK